MHRIVISLILTLLVANNNIQAFAEQITYDSFCKSHDFDCEVRLRSFVQEMGREPATDYELSSVYQVSEQDLFNSPTQPSHSKTLFRNNNLQKLSNDE